MRGECEESRKEKEFRKAYMTTSTWKLSRMGVVPGRVPGSKALGTAPLQRERKLRRQFASAVIGLALLFFGSQQPGG